MTVRPVHWRIAVLLSLIVVAFFSHGFNRAGVITWKQIGPGGGGQIYGIAINPKNPDIILTGSDVGGIFRSMDGGATWSLRNNALIRSDRGASYGFMNEFGFDPVDPNNVYFGALRSSDAGDTWEILVDETLLTGAGSVVNPRDPNIVYTFGYGNVFRSTDRWKRISCKGVSNGYTDCSPSGFFCDAVNAACYQASCLPTSGQVESEPGCPTTNYAISINSLVVDPTIDPAGNPDNARLLACTDQGVYSSINGATTWTKINQAGIPPGAACSSLALHHDEGSGALTLYQVIHTGPFTPLAPPLQVDPNWTIDSWIGGIYASANWGQSWQERNGSDEANELANSSFETPGTDPNLPSGWMMGGTGTVTRRSYTPFEERPPDAENWYLEISSDPDGSGISPVQLQPIQGGALYKISAWCRVVGAGSATHGVLPMLVNIFYYADADGTQPVYWPERSLLWTPTIYKNYTQPLVVQVNAGDPSLTFGWRRFEALFRPPANAQYARIGFDASTGAGTSSLDLVSLEKVHSLPRISGDGRTTWFVDYTDVAVDPTDANVLYTGTRGGTFADDAYTTAISGIWKSTDGGTTWAHVTRQFSRDNVLDAGPYQPVCGDHVCGGVWEDCHTCPDDCTDDEPTANGACCGDNIKQTGETYDSCQVDVPYDPDPAWPDPNGRPYNEVSLHFQAGAGTQYVAGVNPYYGVNSIAIGNSQPPGHPTQGHLTLHSGEHMSTTDGGVTWKEMSSSLYTGGDSDEGTFQANGESTDTFVHSILWKTDSGRNWILYGDNDNSMLISYNGGKSFSREGWQWWQAGVFGHCASSIVKDPLDPDKIYVGVAEGAATFGFVPNGQVNGVLEGIYTAGTPPEVGDWNWSFLGNQSTFPTGGGGVDLVRSVTGRFVASMYGQGIHYLNASGDWTTVPSTMNPDPIDVDMGFQVRTTYHLIQEPTSGRLYVGVGNPQDTRGGNLPAGVTGVWASENDGTSFTQISTVGSDPNCSIDNSMDQEPVVDLLPVDPNVLLVGTQHACGCKNGMGYSGPDPNGNWTGNGGVYRGVRGGGGTWTWTRVLRQPNVTGFAMSPSSPSIVYAYAGQALAACNPPFPGQKAGIYKSTNSGQTWTLLGESAPMNLRHGRLTIKPNDPKKLYAGTIGSGLFEGTLQCGKPVEGFADADGDGVANCADVAASEIGPNPGTVLAGLLSDTYTSNNQREQLKEALSGGVARLVHTWVFPDVPPGSGHQLVLEGSRSGGSGADEFRFSWSTNGVSFTDITNAVIKTASEQQASYAFGPSGLYGTIYIRVTDSVQSNDTSLNTVSIDRLKITTSP